jgi:hypothetical protein
MEYFGINNLKDLPSPKDFIKEENVIGEESDHDYNPETPLPEINTPEESQDSNNITDTE